MNPILDRALAALIGSTPAANRATYRFWQANRPAFNDMLHRLADVLYLLDRLDDLVGQPIHVG